jgi:hypothetical protein
MAIFASPVVVHLKVLVAEADGLSNIANFIN